MVSRSIKIIFFLFLLIEFYGFKTMSQEIAHTDGGNFYKVIEYNILTQGVTESDNKYNLNSKSTLDRIFFGEVNNPIEVVLQCSGEDVSAFRIFRNIHNINQLDVMQLKDSERIVKDMSTLESPVVIPGKLLGELSISLGINDQEKISKYNKEIIRKKQNGELYKPYRPVPNSFHVKNEFTEKLYDGIVSLIDNFKAEGIPPLIMDGNTVTFRCVIENELWTLKIHEPQKRALQLYNICREIIKDAVTNEIDEIKYLNLLDK